jgi:undecaprenyl-diphosphatase
VTPDVSQTLSPLLAADQAILLRVRRYHRPLVTRVMRGLTRLGDAQSWVALCLALICAGGVARQAGVLVGVAAGLATLLSQIVKRTWRRARPSRGIRSGFVALMDDPDAFSFPSGHAAAAFGVAVALAGHGPLGALALVAACGIAASRVYLGAHYPLDVMAGALLGVGSGLVARLVLG